MRRAGEVAEDHAEAVVERHGDADAVGLGVAAQLAHEVAVVEDVVVRERRALGEARGAARVLDVDRVVEAQLGKLGRGVAAGQQLVPRRRVEEDHALQRRAARADLLDHRCVVGRLERGRGDEHPAARLVERVLELGGAVGRVDVDEDHAGLGRRVLDEHPLAAVGTPDAQPVAGRQARGEQRPRGAVDLLVELRVGQAEVLVA